ncbi:MAG: sensor histidine kinase [Candidatus Thorarchaeota archaeon]
MVARKNSNMLVLCIVILAYVLLYLSSFTNFLLFHTAAELLSIGIAIAVFAIGWATSEYVENPFYVFIGCAFVSVAVIDLVHTLAYKGMNLFPGYDANLPTQLWIVGRYLLSFSLLIAPFVNRYRKLDKYVMAMSFFTVATILTAITFTGFFPDCFIEGSGLTPFKIISEYVIILILGITAFLFYRERDQFDTFMLQSLIGAIIFTMIGELAFTFYVDVYGFSNLVGHFMKITAFGLIYLAMIQVSIERPFSSLFKSVRQKEEEVQKVNETLRLTGRMLSHDLRNQLSIISANITLMESPSDESDNTLQAVKTCKQILDNTQAIANLAGTLGDRSPYSIRNLMQEILDDFELEFSIQGECIVQADGTLISAFTNIIQNAAIHSGTDKIEITIQQQGEFCEVQIADFGSGISPSIQETVFDQGVKNGSTGGSGLGLFITRAIINRLGGNISYRQNQPNGSIFIIQLRLT